MPSEQKPLTVAYFTMEIALDPRQKIDGSKSNGGLIRRHFDRALFERIDWPG